MARIYRWIDVGVFLAFAAFVVSHQAWSTRCVIGFGMALAGLALLIVARFQLGSSFTIRAQARKLVTTGLYSRVRHPIYVSGGIAYLGLFIAWGKLIPLLCFVLIYLTQIPRAKQEERVLEQAFGDAYRRYKAGTWF
jgi:protein-S-isoprenylcysteine O-methyltransferase Ste14